MNKYEVVANIKAGRTYKKANVLTNGGFLYFSDKNIFNLNKYSKKPSSVPFGMKKDMFEEDRYVALKNTFVTIENFAKLTTPNYDSLSKSRKTMANDVAKDLIERFEQEEAKYQDNRFKGFVKGFDNVLLPEMSIKNQEVYEEHGKHMGKNPIDMITEDIKRETAKLSENIPSHAANYIKLDGKWISVDILNNKAELAKVSANIKELLS